jgi:hypothetical protein
MKTNSNKVVKMQSGHSIKLRFIDRYFLNRLIPVVGKVETLIAARSLTQKLEITEQEKTKFQFNTEGNDTTWNKKGETYQIEIFVNEFEKMLIQKLLSEANEKEAIPAVCLDFYLANK